MDIENLGPALIEQLIDAGLVKNFADIYTLQKEDILELERMAEKSATNVISAIDQSKNRPLWRFIAALGIRNIGTQTAQILADEFGSLQNLMDASIDCLQKIEQIGPVVAQSIYDYFRNEANRKVIDGLLAAGVKPIHEKDKKSDSLAGKTIVVTGTLENFSRSQIEQTIKQFGGKTVSSVSKNTGFVLAGAEPGSKLDKAKQLGIKIINEKEFLEMIGKS
jgi:DNA ligase (NAD+)